MLTALALLFLSFASCIVGLWSRALLLDFGIIRGFEAGLWACVVVAVLYAAAQIYYRVLLLIIRPTKAVSLDVCDLLSHGAALILLPSLFGFQFEIPYPSIQKLEPLAHFAVFALVLLVFRLMSFFAAVYGEKTSRTIVLRWAFFALLISLLIPSSIYHYLSAVNTRSEVIQVEAAPVSVEHAYTEAYVVPEHKRMIIPMDHGDTDQLAFLCAPPSEEEDFPESVYIIVESYNIALTDAMPPEEAQPTASLTREVVFSGKGWTQEAIARSEIPTDTVNLTFSWMERNPKGLRQRLGVLPPENLNRFLMVHGPGAQNLSQLSRKPSVVILVAEGMGAAHMSIYGYNRNTTPNLKRSAADMILCQEVYTPSPDTGAAVMSLLTGLTPQSHNFPFAPGEGLPHNVCSLAELFQGCGYLTAAFTEGQGQNTHDLTYGSGFEKGFDLFDEHIPMELPYYTDSRRTSPHRMVPAGARVTLKKAGDWIVDHAHVQQFVFVRVRDLTEPRALSRYSSPYMRRGKNSSVIDVYDASLNYLDQQLGQFLERLEALPPEQAPIVILTSTNGFDFRDQGRYAYTRVDSYPRSLHEDALWIPLFIRIPGCPGITNEAPASLIDVAPTLAALTGTPLPYYAEGINLLEEQRIREIISVMGDPVKQSIRSGKWRFTWQSGLARHSLERVEPEHVEELVDIEKYREKAGRQNNIAKEPQLVEAFKAQLQTTFHDRYFGGAMVTMIPQPTIFQ